MSRTLVVITRQTDRARLRGWVEKAPWGTRVEFKAPKRTIPQSDRMWAMLTEVATQLPWHGVRLTADDWKLVFLASLHQEMRIVPNLDGTGFVQLGRSSSDLSKAEMSELMDLIAAFGAQHAVVFADPFIACDTAQAAREAREETTP